jgi:ribosome-binding factor A
VSAEFYYRKPPSQRQLRVGQTIREIIANAILRDCQLNDIFNGVTIVGVRVTPSLRNATVFFSSMYVLTQANINIDQLQKKMNSARGYFRNIIAKNMYMKYVPEIFFAYDKTSEKASKIELLLDSVSSIKAQDE